MTVQFRSVSTGADDDNTVTVSRPSQLADGDLMIAITGGFELDGNFAAPNSGWVFMGEAADGSGLRSKLFKKIASSEPASEDWQFSTGSGGAITVSVAAFYGAYDMHTWNVVVTETDNPSTGRIHPAQRNSVAWQVLVYRQDTTDSPTATALHGTEKIDFTAVDSAAGIRRSQAGYYYGQPDEGDIVNPGDIMDANEITTSQTPTHGIHWSILVGDKESDDENWSSTDGDFAVELELDQVAVDDTGSVETRFQGDITGRVDAVTASAGSDEDLAKDGLNDTWWFSGTATGWLQYDFGSGVTKNVKRYRIASNTGGTGVDPMNWTLEGSNNGSDFTVLDTRTNESFSKRGETREYRVDSPDDYRYYRLDITANSSSGNTTNIRVAEFRLSSFDIWEDVTEFVQEEDKIRIKRGLQGVTQRADYSSAYLTFKNTDGRFSQKKADAEYYGALKRNTPIRISKAHGTKTLQLQGNVEPYGEFRVSGDLKFLRFIGDAMRTPLTDAMTVTGDIDVRVDLHPESWRGDQMLCGISTALGRDPDWLFHLSDEGLLGFRWNASTTSSDSSVFSTIAVPDVNRQAVRATLDVDNGSSGYDLKFYTADTMAGPWTQLGDTITGSSTTQIVYTGGALCVGHVGGESHRGVHGRVYGFELYDGIDGTALSDIDFTTVDNGARSFTDSDDNLWISVGEAVVSNRHYRFHGEVAKWPIAWDSTGNWVYANVTAASQQRRLERGEGTQSVMKRFHTKGLIHEPSAFNVTSEPDAYWSCEDDEDSHLIASDVPGKPAMQVSGGTPSFAAFSGFQESGPILTLKEAKLGGRVSGNSAGRADIRWIMATGTDGIATGANIMTLYGSGDIPTWTLDYTATDTWRLRGTREGDFGLLSIDTGDFSVSTVDELMHCQLLITSSGGTTTASVSVYDPFGNELGLGSDSASSSVGRIYRLNINDGTTAMDDVHVGHIALYDSSDVPQFGSPDNAYIYETAGERIERICREEGVGFRNVGSVDHSEFVGFQRTATPYNLLSTAAHSDQGILVDSLDAQGMEFRTHRSLYNQAAHLELDYDAGELSGELRPTADDAHLVNDYTARRGQAGASRSVLREGPLSKDEVGSYPREQSFSLAHDGQTVDLSSWKMHEGTLDEERYPRIEIALENLRIAADDDLIEKILTMDVGKRIDITDTPSFLEHEDIRQIVVGYEEWFDNFQHNFKLNTVPERVYEIAQYDKDWRFDTDGSTVYQDIDSSGTSLVVSTDSGQPWSVDADDFDVLVDGERMTVTAVADNTDTDTSDTFNRSDSTTDLGSTDGGAVQAWTQNVGTWGINGNAAYISSDALSIATVAGAADFESVSLEVPSWSSDTAHVVFRAVDSTDYIRWGGTVGSAPNLSTVVSSSVDTSVDADSTQFTLAAGDKLSVRCTGSIIECFHNDILALTVSLSTHQTETRVGMRLTTDVPRLDNFELDVAHSPQTFTVTRGVNGVSVPHTSGAVVELYQKPYRGK